MLVGRATGAVRQAGIPAWLTQAGATAARFHLPLLLAIGGAILLGAHYMAQMNDWRVMTDELMWNKLGLGFWEDPLRGSHMRGVDIPVNSILAPLLSSPFWGLMSAPDAFNAIQVLNVVALASAGIPAFLLARELVDWRPAWWIVGALTAVTPWMALAAQVMTESVAYPAFVWALYAMFRAIAEPRPARDVLALVAIAVAFFGRTQFVVLGLLLPGAILLHEIGWRLVRGPARRRAVLDGAVAAVRNHVVFVAVVVLGFAVTLVGPSARSLLGTYGVTVNDDILPPSLVPTAEYQLDLIAVAIGVLPVILFVAWALDAVVRAGDRREHAFATLGLLIAVGLTLLVASFVLRFSQGPQERYLFFIAPIFYVGMAAALLRVRRPAVPFAIGALVVLGLVLRTEYEEASVPTFSSPTVNFHGVLDGRAYELGRLLGFADLSAKWAFVLVCVPILGGCALLIRSGRGRLALAVLGSVLLLYQAAETRYVLQKAVAQGSPGMDRQRDWVDAAMPSGASAAMVPSPANIRSGVPYFDPARVRFGWWDVEFWNKSVDQMYAFGEFDIYSFNLPYRELKLDRATGELRGWDGSTGMILGQSFTAFGPHTTGPSETQHELVLYRVAPRPRAAWATLSPVGTDGWTSASAPTVVRVYPDADEVGHVRRLTFVISASGVEVSRLPYRISGGGADVRGTIRSGPEELVAQRQRVAVCLRSAEPVDLRLRTGAPLQLGPDREVGVRLLGIESETARGSCPA